MTLSEKRKIKSANEIKKQEEEKEIQERKKLISNQMNRIPKKERLSTTDNEKFTNHSMNIMSFKPLDVRLCKPEDIQKRSLEYFKLCIEDEMKPCVAGFALALNVSRGTLLDYLNKKIVIPNDNYMMLQKFYAALNTLIEEYMLNNKINPVSGIFLMKNSFGYTDTQEVVVANNQQEDSTAEGLIEESNLLLGDTENEK